MLCLYFFFLFADLDLTYVRVIHVQICSLPQSTSLIWDNVDHWPLCICVLDCKYSLCLLISSYNG